MANILLSETADNCFSILRGNDLLELLELVENLYLEYRSTLHLPKIVTFGTEIEYEKVLRDDVKNFIENNVNEWQASTDMSVQKKDYGGEIISPILIDERKTWDELKKICSYLKEQKAVTNYRAGGHIHAGTQVLGDNIEGWRIFIKLIILYEHIMFHFFFGDKVEARPRIKKYASPLSGFLYEQLDKINKATTIQEISECVITEKRYSFNFNNVLFDKPKEKVEKNTIEIRCPNGTDEEIIWQNHINTYLKMLISSGASVIDEEYLDYRLARFTPDPDNPLRYNEIFLREALEYVDLIFDNNLDKAYFLRQYLRNFQVGTEIENPKQPANFAKRFIV